MKYITILILVIHINLTYSQVMYFPTENATWERISPNQLNWNQVYLDSLKNMLDVQKTKGFVILHKGKIAVEWYMNGHDETKPWYWASAGKTLTAGLIGVALSEGKLSLDDVSAKYLGKGWTSCTNDNEQKIKVINQLTMTSGLDDSKEADCTDIECLKCIADAGTRWSYHNAPYTLLDGVIEKATGDNINNYFRKTIGSAINMTGLYIKSGYNNVFWSNTLNAARYGLLLLNKGKWNTTQIIPQAFHQAMSTTSQDLNPSYGYLTWLNGKSFILLPGSQIKFRTFLIPSAPTDLYAALGKNDQKIHVVPSQDLVVVRMGEAADFSNASVPLQIDEQIWKFLGPAIGYKPTQNSEVKIETVNLLFEGKTISTNSPDEVRSISLFNTQGQIITRTNNSELTLEQTLPSAIYIVAIRLNNGKLVTKKIWVEK